MSRGRTGRTEADVRQAKPANPVEELATHILHVDSKKRKGIGELEHSKGNKEFRGIEKKRGRRVDARHGIP
jgi:hypothetical protein